MKKVYNFLKYVIVCFTGTFLGLVIYELIHMKVHPEWYEMTSFPWYTGILIYAVVCGGIVLLALIARGILRSVMKKREKE